MEKTQRNASYALTGAQSDRICDARTLGRRVVIMITNLNAAGGASAFISIGAEAAANKGIQLMPGQSFMMSKDAGYVPPQDVIHAYAAAAGTTLAIYEEIEV